MYDNIAKKLLTDKTCKTCKAQKDITNGEKRMCIQWLGEAVGWQWMPTPDENTCDSWRDK